MSKIDTHHHFFPEEANALLAGHAMPGGLSGVPSWSPESALRLMDRFDIATGILSVPVPTRGDHTLARTLNEAGAKVVQSAPDRFGLFATLPLPNTDAALEEIRYAFDDLHADGVLLLANADGVYLGDPRFEPVMAELDRRRAVVFVHPNNLPGPITSNIPPFAADFVLDTTRAAIQLILSGTMDRYRQLKIILSHAGGFLPYIAYRVLPMLAGGNIEQIDDRLDALKLFYFDLALSSSPTALPSLLALADPTHVLFGSDTPAAPDDVVAFFDAQFEGYPFDLQTRWSITCGNAEQLFPRLQ